jgi:hypothetical protein
MSGWEEGRTTMKALLLSVCMLAGAVGVVGAGVTLNEILVDPARDWDGDSTYYYRDDEWVEIVNIGGSVVDVAGYRISTADTAWRYEFTGTLQPGEHRVVFGSESYLWEKQHGYPAYGLRLGNSGGTVQLWRLTEIDTVLVDEIVYDASTVRDDCSYGRNPDGSGGWGLFDGLNPDPDGGNGCLPTPGATNQCDSASRSITWGKLKRLFVAQ